MAILIMTSNAINNKIARSRGEMIIAACEKYKDKNHEYPEKLSALVPDFINEIPVAKYTLMTSSFSYLSYTKDSHSLLYINLWPFGRWVYPLEDQKWTYLD